MRFTFLGTGTSAGVPVIACDCATCTSADPRDRRTRTGAALRWTDDTGAERVALIDTTPDLREQALRHGLRRCDAIFYTHNHVDHTFGLDDVRRFNAVMKAPIDVYAERHTLDDLRRIYRHVFEQERNVNKSFVATLIANEIEPGRGVVVHGVRFTPVRLLHGRLPIVGYRIERVASAPGTSGATGSTNGAAFATSAGAALAAASSGIERATDDVLPLAYCTDVSAVPPESWRALSGVKTLAISALRYRKHATHQTVDEALGVAAEIGAARTYFIHMTHDILHADLEARLPEGVQLAYDGLTLG